MYQLESFQYGMLAYSKAGHDKGNLYVIIKADHEYVYLVDGIHKKISNPKKKKIKHIQIINEVPESIESCIHSGKKVTDEDIKRSIKIFLKK